MNKDEFYSLLDKSLNISHVNSISVLINKYPYFHGAIYLKLMNYSTINDSDFMNYISEYSTILPKREAIVKLYISNYLLMINKIESTFDKSALDLIIDDIQGKIAEINSKFLMDLSLSAGYLKNNTSKTEKLDDKKIKRIDLVEKFIKENPSIGKQGSIQTSTKSDSFYKNSLDNENIVSETLAIIYTKQGNFEKARDTYIKLIALFPEKDAYFRDKIESILIKNKD